MDDWFEVKEYCYLTVQIYCIRGNPRVGFDHYVMSSFKVKLPVDFDYGEVYAAIEDKFPFCDIDIELIEIDGRCTHGEIRAVEIPVGRIDVEYSDKK